MKNQHINIALLGHVDCGKSTTTGHLLYKCGMVSQQVMSKNVKQCNEYGKPSFKYSWISYRLKAEKQRGITIITSYNYLKVNNYQFTLIDTPGHTDFIKNMIKGTFQADAAILIVAAAQGQFECGISKYGKTYQHVMITHALGIKQLIVCINKMDDKTVQYSQNRFNQIKQQISLKLKSIGYKPQNVIFIPISAFFGDNLTQKSLKMEWYNGPFLLQIIKQFKSKFQNQLNHPFRMSIENVFKISGVGTVVTGQIISGLLKPNNKVSLPFSGKNALIIQIEKQHEKVELGKPGQRVGLSLKGILRKQIAKGQIISYSQQTSIKIIKKFEARISLLTNVKQIKKNYSPIFYFCQRDLSCQIVEIISRCDRKTGKQIEQNPAVIKGGQSGIVKIKPLSKLSCQTFANSSLLGRFLILQQNKLIGTGIVRQVQFDDYLSNNQK